jgi:vancomycin resistance protein YoaR
MRKFMFFAAMMLLFTFVVADSAQASETTILEGIFVDSVSLGGCTAEEALALVDEYVAELGQKEITLNLYDDYYIAVTPDDMGLVWTNQEIIEEATILGQGGNVITRYKAIKDLENSHKIYELEYSFDPVMIYDIIADHYEEFYQEAIDATMERVDGEFVINEGQLGVEINVEASLDALYDYLNNEWNKDDASTDLVVEMVEYRGSYEELSQLTDVLGTYNTTYSTWNVPRSTNIARGVALCNGTLLYPGDVFSTLETITPFTAENGYLEAGSFANGQLVDTIAGGICQVSTTLYNAVMMAELRIVVRSPHSMMVSYVQPSFDAAIAESANMDFKFANDTDNPIYISGTTRNGRITFTIYGVETRPANRRIKYESEVLEYFYPESATIIQDPGQPIGYVQQNTAYIGNRSQLWKIVEIDGQETSRERVNSSRYKAVGESVTVGTLTADPAAYETLQAAIATGNVNYVVAIAHALAPPPPPEEPPVE